MQNPIYKIRVVRGAFADPDVLDRMGAVTVERLEGDKWQSIDELQVDMEQIKLLQKSMTNHFDDKNIPWYLDGLEIGHESNMVVAFGADDGNNGKIFLFDKENETEVTKVIEYALEKGIPQEQLDFL